MTSLSLVLLALILAAAPVAAQGGDRLDAVASAADRATSPAAEGAVVERMAGLLGTTPDSLRAERASTRLGWGDLFISHRIATRGGHPLAKVFAARRSGAPWGDIANDARVEPDLLVQDVAALWPEAARATPSAGDAARPGPPPPPTGVGAGPAAPAVTPPPPAPAAASEEPKRLGGRVIDFLRGTGAPRTEDVPTERTHEEIRDRMIRGGGGRAR